MTKMTMAGLKTGLVLVIACVGCNVPQKEQTTAKSIDYVSADFTLRYQLYSKCGYGSCWVVKSLNGQTQKTVLWNDVAKSLDLDVPQGDEAKKQIQDWQERVNRITPESAKIEAQKVLNQYKEKVAQKSSLWTSLNKYRSDVTCYGNAVIGNSGITCAKLELAVDAAESQPQFSAPTCQTLNEINLWKKLSHDGPIEHKVCIHTMPDGNFIAIGDADLRGLDKETSESSCKGLFSAGRRWTPLYVAYEPAAYPQAKENRPSLESVGHYFKELGEEGSFWSASFYAVENNHPCSYGRPFWWNGREGRAQCEGGVLLPMRCVNWPEES